MPGSKECDSKCRRNRRLACNILSLSITTYFVTIINAGTATVPATRSVTIQEPVTHLPAPLKAYQDHIQSVTSKLLPGLATLLKETSTENLASSHRLSLKERNVARMEADDEYVPVSARVAFKLQAWKEAEESTEFTTITTETNTIVKAFQLNLKDQIIKNIKLERDVLRVKIRQELCESLFSVVELYLEALGSEPQFTHEILLAILQANGTSLLRHVPGTVQDFTILYRTVHNVPTETHATVGMVRPRNTIRIAYQRHCKKLEDLPQAAKGQWTLHLSP
jgi:hypothetical protein